MREVLYVTKQERTEALLAAHDLGERMLHDDFGVGPEGEDRLTFEKQKPAPPLSIEAVRLNELWGKLADPDGSMELSEVVEMLRLERRGTR